MHMRSFFRTFSHAWREESGATLVEYGVALIIAIVVGSVVLNNLAVGATEAMNEAETVLPNEGDGDVSGG